MKFQAKLTDPVKFETDLLVVFAKIGKTAEDVELFDEAKIVDKNLGGVLFEALKAEKFEAQAGKTFLLHSRGSIPAKRVVVAGMGKLNELSIRDLQIIGAGIARRAKGTAVTHISVALSSELLDIFGTKEAVQHIVEGITLGSYAYLKHKSEETRKKETMIEDIALLVTPGRLNAAVEGIREGELVASAVAFARDLVNEPPSDTTPTYLGEIAKTIAKNITTIDVEVFGETEIRKLGMGGLLGIARGSDQEPKFIKLRYSGGGRKTIAIVGKGITFDTGGLSLKPSEHMETMKLDMAGAAAILGVFSVLSAFKPKVNVVGLISATENMPGSRAIKPGDVVRAMNGKTMEILNTDAEGRVVLADALSYAALKIKPDTIIDLATLTGACVVALGEDIAGLFANDAKLAGELKIAASQSGERIWELPLAKEYKEALKSTVADIKNISGKRYGGAINGALFLAEFVPDAIAWAHLDIAGPAFAEKDTPLEPRGGTGFGVRLLLSYLLGLK